MAEELERDNVLRLAAVGARYGATDHTTGGEPYRGFLEDARTNGVLPARVHLTNLELKALEPDAQDGAEQ